MRIVSLGVIIACTTYVMGCLFLKVSRSMDDDGWVSNNFVDIYDRRTHWLQFLDACYLTLATMTSVGYGDMMALAPGEKQFTVVVIIVGGFVLA